MVLRLASVASPTAAVVLQKGNTLCPLLSFFFLSFRISSSLLFGVRYENDGLQP